MRLNLISKVISKALVSFKVRNQLIMSEIKINEIHTEQNNGKEAINNIETKEEDSISTEEKAKINDSEVKRHPGFGQVPEGMSKNAFKKLKKQEIRMENRKEWIEKVRKKEKQKKKEKKALIRQGLLEKKPKINLEQQTKSDIRIVIDMDFNEYMSDIEISSVCNQLARCYSANRVAKIKVNLIATDISGKIQNYLDTKKSDAKNWKDVLLTEDKFIDIIDKQDLVYLTADSENTIQNLDPKKAYIIGGIVDKNRHKLLTLNKAKQLNIATAKLPIGDYIKMASRKVLAVNHVFEILSEYLSIHDWEQAFLKVIPQRKFKKNQVDNNEDQTHDKSEASEENNTNDQIENNKQT